MHWYKQFWAKYATFSGRARREEYWIVFLINFVLSLLLSFLGGFPGLIYSLAALIPGLALTARRLHDTGRSGWWMLIAFIPLIGTIILLVFCALEGEAEENAYGSNPKLTGAGAA